MQSGELNLTLTVPDHASVTGFTRLAMCGTQDTPLVVANDIAAVLGIKNIRQNLAKMDDDEKGVLDQYTLGGIQKVLVVNEMGLYRLIFTSRVPAAKRFQRWVLHDVMPTIRKYGCYPAPAGRTPLPIGVTRDTTDMLILDGQRVIAEELGRLARQYELRIESVAARLTEVEGRLAALNQPAPAVQAKPRRTTNADRERESRYELKAQPNRTNAQIAEAVATRGYSVCAATVGKYRKLMEQAGEISPQPVRTTKAGWRIRIHSHAG